MKQPKKAGRPRGTTRLGHRDLLVLATIAARADAQPIACISTSEISEAIGIRARDLWHHILKLEAFGAIAIARRPKGSKLPNAYLLMADQDQALKLRERKAKARPR